MGAARLQRMREILPLLQAAPADGSGEYVRYDVEIGFACASRLLVSDTVAVCNAELAKGTIFPVHYHAENEWLIVHSGELIVYIDGTRHELMVGDFLHIPAGAAHSLAAVTDVAVVAVSVPPAEGFPGVH